MILVNGTTEKLSLPDSSGAGSDQPNKSKQNKTKHINISNCFMLFLFFQSSQHEIMSYIHFFHNPLSSKHK